MGTHPIFESDFDCLTDMSEASVSSDEEYVSLADQLKEKYVSEIEAAFEKVKRVDQIEQEITSAPKSRKRKIERKLASWLDVKVEVQSANSTGPGCSICISTFEELQAEGKSLKTTPCGHVFCSDCLELSIEASNKCPKCRQKVTLKKCVAIYPDLLN